MPIFEWPSRTRGFALGHVDIAPDPPRQGPMQKWSSTSRGFALAHAILGKVLAAAFPEICAYACSF